MIQPQVFKANDVRGLIGGSSAEWDVEGARALGAAFVEAFALASGRFVLGRDMRIGGRELSLAFAEGAMAQGASVLDIGLSSTDQLWYASGATHLPGVQFTASHNPAAYNGAKFCLPDAAPITPDLMARIKELTYVEAVAVQRPGEYAQADLLDSYAAHLHSLVDLAGMRRLKVVVDAGNGMAGLTTPAVLAPLPVDLIGLYLELDGTFPNHPANPLEPANLVDARRAVIDNGADLGLVFDGDADRCFIIDERGVVVDPSLITALIALAELRREPGATIVINTITSRAVWDAVTAAGGTVAISQVGHTRMKAMMAERGAVFGGEHSAHYYFRDFWGADTGMLAALHILALVGGSSQPMSALTSSLPHYAASGEINTRVADPAAVLDRMAQAFAGRGKHDWADGLLVTGDGWWLSVRESNTEPLLRLNVEAQDEAMVTRLRDEAMSIIGKGI